MAPHSPRRHVVQTLPGPGTTSGAGDTVIDNHGQRYRVVDAYEARMIEQSTGGFAYTLGRNGEIE